MIAASPNRLLPAAGLGFFLLALAIYQPVLRGGCFTDDWDSVLTDPSRHIAGSFSELHPFLKYRPVELSIFALSQTLFGGTTLPVHLLQAGMHAALACLVFHILLRWQAGTVPAIAGGLLVLVSQAAASSVGGIDSLSTTLVTLAGTSVLWWLCAGAEGLRRPAAWSGVAFAVAMFSKESTIGYLPLAAYLALGFPMSGCGRPPRRRWALVGALAGVTVLYLAVRSSLGAVSPEFRTGSFYQEHPSVRTGYQLGSNVVVNPAFIWLATWMPVSTLTVFDAIRARAWAWPALALGATGGLLACCVWGLALGRRLRRGLALLLAGTVALAPVLFLWHPSELYSYTTLPFAALCVGLALHALLSPGSPRWRRIALAAIMLVVLFSNTLATRAKVHGMAENGRLAASLIEQLHPWVDRVPAGGELVLIEPRAARPDYSVFRVRSFYLLDSGEILKMVYERPDMRVRRVEPGRWGSGEERPDQVRVTLDASMRVRPQDPAFQGN